MRKKGRRNGVPRKRNRAYQKGYRFELRVKKHFERLGYYVVRKYASKGAEDLIAIQALDPEKHSIIASRVLLIQCKNLKVEKALSTVEKNNLKKLAKWTGGTSLHVFNRNHKLIFEEIV